MNLKRIAVLSSFVLAFLASCTIQAQDTPPKPVVHCSVEILSNLPPKEMTVFTDEVLRDLITRIKHAWYPLIPEEARPPKNGQGRVAIELLLHPDGKIGEMRLSQPSGKVALDQAAWAALTGAQPFKVLPPELSKEMIRLRFNFCYNVSEVEDLLPSTADMPARPKTSSPVN